MNGRSGMLLLVGAFVLIEVVRELYLLKRLGFEPGRFAQWLKSDDLICGTEVA